MTAQNAFIRGNAVHLLTDAAYLDQAGRLVFVGSKVRQFPHLNAVCVTRGEGEIDSAFTAMLGTSFTTFDGLLKDFREAVRVVMDGHDKGRGYAPFDLVVAGISERSGRPAIWVARRGDSPEPIDCSEWPYWAAPYNGVAAELQAQGIDLTSPAFDPVTQGVSLLEAQRRQVIQPHGFPPCHIIGGFGQLTTVTAGEITTRSIVRWNDQVGQRITP